MNELIKELIEQCYEKHELLGTYQFNKERFAELIAKECADLCDRFQARDVGMQPAECAGAIRLMFGVEK